MATDAEPVSAARVVAPATTLVARVVDEDEPAGRVFAEPQPSSTVEQLDEREGQVADERVPALAVCAQATVAAQPERRDRHDRIDLPVIRLCRFSQVAYHIANRGEGPQLLRGRLSWRHLNLVIGEVADSVRRVLQMVVVTCAGRRPRKPVGRRAVTRVREPDEIGE